MKALPTLARRQRGVIMIMYALMLIVILGFAAFVVDLGLVYLRRAQLQALADNMAITAATRLNGRANGLANASFEALVRMREMPGLTDVDSADDILRFAADPSGGAAGWQLASEVGGTTGQSAADMMYVQVDMGALPAALRQLQPVLSGIFGSTAPFDVRPVAVAGRRSMHVTPLAICARSTSAEEERSISGGKNGLRERTHYGFRVGVTYNLLDLNPHGTDPVFYYVDPLTPPGTLGPAGKTTDDVMAPFMCSGTVAFPRIGAGMLKIARRTTFGLASQLNSRFNDYPNSQGSSLACTRNQAPPDTNIRSYVGTGAAWHPDKPQRASAEMKMIDKAGGGKQRATIADMSTAELGALAPPATDYGVRWAFHSPRTAATPPVKFTSWSVLYPSSSSQPNPTGWPDEAPYFAGNSSGNFTAPSAGPSRKGRRLMYLPLLDCDPAAAGFPNINEARVLAYGMFFLTARASAGEVPGEFAGYLGLASEYALLGGVELVR